MRSGAAVARRWRNNGALHRAVQAIPFDASRLDQWYSIRVLSSVASLLLRSSGGVAFRSLTLAALHVVGCGRAETDDVHRAAATDTARSGQSSMPGQGAATSSGAEDPAGPVDASAQPSRSSDDAADAFVPSECPPLGFEYALGCEDCPSRTVSCSCDAQSETTGSEVTSFQTGCSYGTCFLDVSCDVWCAAVAAQPAVQILWAEYCPQSRLCEGPSECGDGHCYGETGGQRGRCVDGADGSDCYDPSDCRGGFCGPRGCTSGQPDAICATVADCVAGSCIGDVAVDGFGFCSTGNEGEKCKSDDDCAPALYCHRGVTRCQTGELGSPCHTNEQCHSGACYLGNCVTGELGGGCDDDDDCESGHCRVAEGDQPAILIDGTCIVGAAGEACFFDGDCEGGHCLTVAHNVAGLCTGRAAGDPCFGDADCNSGSCSERSQDTSSDCAQTSDAGAPCEGTGLCIAGATCSMRTCD